MSFKKTQSTNSIIIDASNQHSHKIAITNERGLLEELIFDNSDYQSIRNNIYLAKVVRIEPSLECAFVEYGSGKNGFLPFSEIHPDYYQIPLFDREKLHNEIKAEQQNKIHTEKSNQLDHSADTTDLEEASNDMIVRSEESDEKTQRNYKLYQKYNIQEVIKRGQNVLVQVYKDERGNKGASLTTYISLLGRYCVFMPNSPNRGISKKISSAEEKTRINNIIENLNIAEGVGLVARTASDNVSEEDFRKDYQHLIDLWNGIRKKTLTSSSPTLIYQEYNSIIQTIRDTYNPKIHNIVIDNAEKFEEIKKYLEIFSQFNKSKILHYNGKMPIFIKYDIEPQISRLLQNRIELPSGGYLIIEQTEALFAIDVNSGKATEAKNVEDTALKINLEAVNEIARQLRLRDIGGLVVVDLIDMTPIKHRKSVEMAAHRAFANDKAKVQISRISIFGLLELSRQRIRSSLPDLLTNKCEACLGTGRVKSLHTNISNIFTAIETIFAEETKNINHITVEAERGVIFALKNQESKNINATQDKYKIRITLLENATKALDYFAIYNSTTEEKTLLHEYSDKPTEQTSHSESVAEMDVAISANQDNRSNFHFIKRKKHQDHRGDRYGKNDRRDRRNGPKYNEKRHNPEVRNNFVPKWKNGNQSDHKKSSILQKTKSLIKRWLS